MKKQRIQFALLMAIVMMAMSPQKVWALGGSGTSSSPYTIANASDLVAFANKVNGSEQGAYGKLTADITLTSAWTAMGTSSKPYTGTFDGQGHKITGLNLTAKAANAGLFGCINGATIKNFSLAGTVSSGFDNTGSVVGYAKGSSTIQDIVCTVNITMTAAKSHLGGIAGNIENGTSVLGCTYSGTLNAGSSTDSNGGIVGFAHANCSGTIKYCFFNGTVKTTGSNPQMGGILGYTNDESNNFGGVQDCYTDGEYEYSGDNKYANAIVGRIRNRATTTINNTYLSGTADRPCNTDGPSIPASNHVINITVKCNSSRGELKREYIYPTSNQAAKIQFTAEPFKYNYFAGWFNGYKEVDKGEGNSFTDPLTQSIGPLQPHFEHSLCYLKIATDPEGIPRVSLNKITDENNRTLYAEDAWAGTRNVYAIEDNEWEFVKWSDGVKTIDTYSWGNFKGYTGQLDLTEDTKVIAYYQKRKYNINVVSENENYGTVTGGGTFECYQPCRVQAFPKPGYEFVKWIITEGAVNNNANPLTLSTTKNMTVTAYFQRAERTITIDSHAGTGGTVSPSGPHTYYVNDKVTLTATPNEGYHFVTWTDGNTDNPRVITVTAEKIYQASFEHCTYTDWVSDTPATCLLPGSHHRTCTKCGTKNTQTIPALGHSYTDWVIDTPATCGTEGCQHTTCSLCGTVVNEVIPAQQQLHVCTEYVNGIGECEICHMTVYEAATQELGSNRYLIQNAGQLYYFANLFNTSTNKVITCRLENDIVINDGTFDEAGNFTATGATTHSTPLSWIPIGGEGNTCSLDFDGNGHTISGLYINDENATGVGLLGKGKGSVYTLGLINCYIRGGDRVGGICGTCEDGEISIIYTYVTGQIHSTRAAGAILGAVADGCTASVKCNYTTATVSGSLAGSICGVTNSGSEVLNCFSTGDTPSIAENHGITHLCEKITNERLASGEIAWKLNAIVDSEGNWTKQNYSRWFQAIGTENAPGQTVKSTKEVYQYHNCQGADLYTNDKSMSGYAGHSLDENGECLYCDYTASVTHTGTCGTCTWTIYDDGRMIVAPTEGETGTLDTWSSYPQWFDYRDEVTYVRFDGKIIAQTMYQMFDSFQKVKTIKFGNLNTENVTNMKYAFAYCYALTDLDVSGFNTDKVTEIGGIFTHCSSLSSLDLSGFNTANVTSMFHMFLECTSLASLKLSDNFVMDDLLNDHDFKNCGKNVRGGGRIYFVSDEGIREMMRAKDMDYMQFVDVDAPADIARVTEILLGDAATTADLQHYDMNGDGQITISDLTKVIKALIANGVK